MTEDGRGARDEREAKLDRRLDAALRQMADVEGPVDMRHRVLARLSEPQWAVVSSRVMLVATAVITLAVGIAVVLRAPAVHAPTSPVARRDAPRTATPVSPPVAQAASPRPARSARLTVRPAARQTARRQAPERLTAAAATAEVTEMEPIALSPLAVTPMSSEHVTVRALRIERLQLEPLAEAQP